MIRTLIFITLSRDLQGGPVYVRCANCGTVSDAPTRTLSVSTWRRAVTAAHHYPARVNLPRLRPGGAVRSRRAARQRHPHSVLTYLPVPLRLKVP
jgi:hypothetical protein